MNLQLKMYFFSESVNNSFVLYTGRKIVFNIIKLIFTAMYCVLIGPPTLQFYFLFIYKER